MHYLKITNKTRYYKDGVTKMHLQVPDYHCEESRCQRSNDLGLRLWSEIERYNKAGGKVLFATLTYDNLHLPQMDLEDGRKISCFNKMDKDRFLNSLRNHFTQNIKLDFPSERKDVQGIDLPFRYYWASEYGSDGQYVDDKGNARMSTARPHYHCLFFFPPKVVAVLGDVWTPYKELVQHFWHYGMCRWSKNYPCFVESDFAALYVSKYCNKDLNFWKKKELKEYLYDSETGELNKDRYLSIKAKLPFHKGSNHVGENLKYSYTKYEHFRDGVDFQLSSEKSKGKPVYHKCPLYIQRKTIIAYDKLEKRYKYTAFGVEVKKKIFLDTLSERVLKLDARITPVGLRKLIDTGDIYKLAEKFGYDWKNHVELSDFLREKIYKHSVHSGWFLLYHQCWRGALIDLDIAGQYDAWFHSLSYKEFVDESFVQFAKHYQYNSYDCIEEEGFFYVYGQPPMTIPFDGLSFFAGYDEAEKIINEIDTLYRDRVTNKYLEDRERRKRTKLLLTS